MIKQRTFEISKEIVMEEMMASSSKIIPIDIGEVEINKENIKHKNNDLKVMSIYKCGISTL